jgi:cell division protein FtsQ
LSVVGSLAWAALVGAREAHDYATTSPRFEVRALVYEPTAHVSDGRLRELMALQPGTNILALDLDDLAERVARDPWVARAEVIRELPDTVIVRVEEHEPVAVLLAGAFYLLDGDGKPFKRLERSERQQLPIVTGVGFQMLTQDPQESAARIERALDVIAAYQAKHRPRLSEVHVGQAGDVTLYTAELGTELRLGRGQTEPRLARLDALRAALGEDADALAVVHLDATIGAEGKDRVVASFFADNEIQPVTKVPQAAAEGEEEDAEAEHARKRRGIRRKRIPRYE